MTNFNVLAVLVALACTGAHNPQATNITSARIFITSTPLLAQQQHISRVCCKSCSVGGAAPRIAAVHRP